MASVREYVSLERSFQCLRLIEKDGYISSRKLADSLNISNGAAYYVLSALIEKGYVKAFNFKNNRNKSGYAYLLTPAGMKMKAKLTFQFVQRKKVEFQALRAEIEALEKECMQSLDDSSRF